MCKAVVGADRVRHPLAAGLRHQVEDRLIPPMGKVVTGDAQPYQYLVESIRKFPNPQAFSAMLATAGFKRVKHTSYTGNIATLFSGWKI